MIAGSLQGFNLRRIILSFSESFAQKGFGWTRYSKQALGAQIAEGGGLGLYSD
jgi:hypothetical protein